MKVIYFDVDTLRPDHLSCYGGSIKTPYIDALAADGVCFTQAYASNTPCMPSRAAVLTGCFGVRNGVETHGRAGCEIKLPPQNALARVLAWHGFHTATVSSFGRHPAPWFYNGFSHVMDPSYRCRAENFQRFAGQAVNDAAIEFLDGFRGEDLFLHLHYWDPHGPLTPPEAWIDRSYTPDTSLISDKMLADLAASPLYRGGRHMKIVTRSDLEELIRLYDAEVRYTDFLIGQMCDALRCRGWYQDCAIVLSADHGEQYGEGQMILEHGTVHDSCIHIPLILKYPGNKNRSARCSAPVYGLDIAPTITRFWGIEPPGEWDGIPLQETLSGKAERRNYLVCEHGLYTCQRAVLCGKWKMVHTYSPGLWDFPEYALYDREADPAECEDVKKRHPRVLEELQRLEKKWLSEVLEDGPDLLEQLGRENGQSGMAVAEQVTRQLCEESSCKCESNEGG